jgi:hypothetical protein
MASGKNKRSVTLVTGFILHFSEDLGVQKQ